jgi:hypothetical protein
VEWVISWLITVIDTLVVVVVSLGTSLLKNKYA